jgi:beta-lactam-binding protein with PASTA domain
MKASTVGRVGCREGGYDRPPPNVTGLGVNQAVAAVSTLGLHANVIAATPTGTLTVTRVIPSVGTFIAGGSTVTLHVGKIGSRACP